jgi:ATP-dependent DNA helicase RecG
MARRLAQLAELDVTILKGVGEKHATSLREAFGIETVLDLLTHYPRNYIDRSRQARLADLGLGEEAMVLVTVERISGRRTRGPRSKALVTADVTDGTGHLRVTFFNQG